jgi:hypothetical protein
MAGLDLAAAAQHIYTKLKAQSALSALTVVEGVASSSTAYPYVRFEYMDGVGRLVMGLGAVYVMGKPQYTVQVIAKDQPYSALDAYVQAIYTALHNTSSTNAKGEVFGSVVLEPIQYDEPDEGNIYRHAGWTVQVYTRSA